MQIMCANQAGQSSARAQATTPEKAKKAESARLYKRMPQTPTVIQFYCELQTFNMLPKTACEAAKTSNKATPAIAEDKKEKTPEKATKPAAILFLNYNKRSRIQWTLVMNMPAKEVAILRRSLHFQFKKLNLDN